MQAVIYLSQNRGFESELDIQDMISFAQEQNAKHYITGYLYFANNMFVQYFEGKKEQVDALWTNISKDPRHEVLFSSRSEINERRFNTWYMRDWTSSTRVESFLNEYLSEQLQFLSSNQSSFIDTIFPKESKVWKIVDNIGKATNPLEPDL